MKPSSLSLVIFLIFLNIQVFFSQNVNREFRAVWIATVKNIDWPQKADSTSVQQKESLIKMLDFFKNLNFNAVIFQIRPAADAFYNSEYEPWSVWLTDSIGSKPGPYFDPLAFIIEEAHKRGMELHAWLNPYRAVVDYKNRMKQGFPLLHEKPDWFIKYGNNVYFNPGIPEVRAYTKKVVADIVQKYDVDAIHFDDYFYPYKIDNEHFNDDESFKNFGAAYYPDRIEDWRRNNVNLLIHELHNTVKSIKPWVQFGISPFGVWRNISRDSSGSDTNASQTNYDDLYADVILWLENNWIDYIVPQAYWEIGFEPADYKKVVDWWNEHSYRANLYIGQAMYRQSQMTKVAWQQQDPTEIERQLDYNHTKSKVKGTVYFSAKSFKANTFGINDLLKQKYYKLPALPPVIFENPSERPSAVRGIAINKVRRGTYSLSWQPEPEDAGKKAVKYLIYQFGKNEKIDAGNPERLIAITGETYYDLGRKNLKRSPSFVIVPVNRSNETGTIKVFRYRK